MAEESFTTSKTWLAWIFQEMFRPVHTHEQDNFDAFRYPETHRNAFFSDVHAHYLSFLVDNADAFHAARSLLEDQTLKLTADILAAVTARPKPPFCVGFATETHGIVRNAEAKRRSKKVPLLIANRAQDAMGAIRTR